MRWRSFTPRRSSRRVRRLEIMAGVELQLAGGRGQAPGLDDAGENFVVEQVGHDPSEWPGGGCHVGLYLFTPLEQRRAALRGRMRPLVVRLLFRHCRRLRTSCARRDGRSVPACRKRSRWCRRSRWQGRTRRRPAPPADPVEQVVDHPEELQARSGPTLSKHVRARQREHLVARHVVDAEAALRRAGRRRIRPTTPL